MKSLTVALVAIASLGTTPSFAAEKVIYGQDNRRDIYEVTNPLYLSLAQSTVALIQRGSITQNSSGMLTIEADSFEKSMGVCKKERFSDQPSGGFCSGTLIGKNHLLTAGHCITDMNDCQATQFVFGYSVNKKGAYPTQASSDDVVGCKSIVYRVQENKGADFAIIELDREIKNHAPVKLASRTTSNELKKGDQIVMIGHPAGLPTKVEDGGKIRDNSQKGYLVANTDSYGGNSGSGVFNRTTGELEGVLVRGEDDYVEDNGCYVSNICTEDGCRGEDITKVSSVIPQLPKL